MARRHSETMPGCSTILHRTKPRLQEQHAAGTEGTKQRARMTLYVQVVTRMTPYVQVFTRMTSNSWSGRSHAFYRPCSSVLQATRWFGIRTKIMVLRFQDNGGTSSGFYEPRLAERGVNRKHKAGVKPRLTQLYPRCLSCMASAVTLALNENWVEKAQLSETQLLLTCCPAAVRSKHGPTQHPCGSWRIFPVISRSI